MRIYGLQDRETGDIIREDALYLMWATAQIAEEMSIKIISSDLWSINSGLEIVYWDLPEPKVVEAADDEEGES